MEFTVGFGIGMSFICTFMLGILSAWTHYLLIEEDFELIPRLIFLIFISAVFVIFGYILILI